MVYNRGVALDVQQGARYAHEFNSAFRERKREREEESAIAAALHVVHSASARGAPSLFYSSFLISRERPAGVYDLG